MNAPFTQDLPKGIQKITPLPDLKLTELWESIIVEETMKEHLLSQALLNFTMRPKVSRAIWFCRKLLVKVEYAYGLDAIILRAP